PRRARPRHRRHHRARGRAADDYRRMDRAPPRSLESIMTASQAPAISITNLSKYYGPADGHRVKALENVSLTVGRGEFVSIIGPSGCGKTTMLKMVGGILGWDEGSVEVLGKGVTGPGPERATVFQS